MSDSFVLAIITDIDNTQANLIHVFVKANSSGYWHQFEDVWLIKSSHGARYWLDKLSVFTPLLPSSMLVLDLPDEGSRGWAAIGDAANFDWLLKNYARPGGEPIESTGRSPKELSTAEDGNLPS